MRLKLCEGDSKLSTPVSRRDNKLREVQSKDYGGKTIQKQPPELFHNKAAPKNFVIFTGKHLCWSLFLVKFRLVKNRLQQTDVFL